MNNETTEQNTMLEARRILRDHGYKCREFGLNFRITDPNGIPFYETITGLIDLARRLSKPLL